FVAEDVEPTADELVIDAVLVHPRAAIGEIGKPGRDRARRLRAGKLHAHAFVVAQQPDAGKLRGLSIEPLIETLGNEMRVDVDDELHHGKLIGVWVGRSKRAMSALVTASTASLLHGDNDVDGRDEPATTRRVRRSLRYQLHEALHVLSASKIARCEIGSAFTSTPSGASASFTALATAAGAPR